MQATTQKLPTQRKAGLFTGWSDNTLAGLARRKALMGYLFLLPTVLGILIFTAGPVLVSFGLSFYDWNVFTPAEYIGSANYTRLFTDTHAITGFYNTIRFVLITIPLQIILALLLALAVRQRMITWLRYYFRTAFFLPFLFSGTATAIVLAYLLHKEFGAVNYYLGFLGVPRIPWLISSDIVLYTLVITYIWQNIGFTLIGFLGGLSTISAEVLDAADVDGAQGWRRLWYVTLPMLSPSILFAAVVGVIGGLQIFDQPYIMTRGGPGDASRTAVMTMYEAAFKNQEIGYGSGIAVILFIMIMIVTAIQFGFSKRWVFYQ